MINKDMSERFKNLLINIDMVFHMIAAVLLFIACGFVFYYAGLNLLEPTRTSIINLVHDVLLALIVLELLWTVIRFLKKQRFSLSPFLAIGIIAAVRKILLIEAQGSSLDAMSYEKLIEIGVSALLVIVFMAAYYLSVKSERLEQ